MAESWTGSVPAGRACQDSSYCLPPIYDRAYGKESPYLKGLYGSCCCGRRTGTGCICIYGQSEYSNYYFLYYCRTDFVAHPDIKIFIIIAGVVIALAVIGVIFLNATVSVDGSGSFRLRRIMVWLHPEEYADSWGYQTIQALYAIGSGGFFGRGLGNSIQKLGSVPEAQNDMIFQLSVKNWGFWRSYRADALCISVIQAVCYCTECTGYVWLTYGQWDFYSHSIAGYS